VTISLRDYFAAKAMEAIVHKSLSEGYQEKLEFWDEPEEIARMSYEVADVMIKISTKKIRKSNAKTR